MEDKQTDDDSTMDIDDMDVETAAMDMDVATSAVMVDMSQFRAGKFLTKLQQMVGRFPQELKDILSSCPLTRPEEVYFLHEEAALEILSKYPAKGELSLSCDENSIIWALVYVVIANIDHEKDGITQLVDFQNLLNWLHKIDENHQLVITHELMDWCGSEFYVHGERILYKCETCKCELFADLCAVCEKCKSERHMLIGDSSLESCCTIPDKIYAFAILLIADLPTTPQILCRKCYRGKDKRNSNSVIFIDWSTKQLPAKRGVSRNKDERKEKKARTPDTRVSRNKDERKEKKAKTPDTPDFSTPDTPDFSKLGWEKYLASHLCSKNKEMKETFKNLQVYFKIPVVRSISDADTDDWIDAIFSVGLAISGNTRLDTRKRAMKILHDLIENIKLHTKLRKDVVVEFVKTVATATSTSEPDRQKLTKQFKQFEESENLKRDNIFSSVQNIP